MKILSMILSVKYVMIIIYDNKMWWYTDSEWRFTQQMRYVIAKLVIVLAYPDMIGLMSTHLNAAFEAMLNIILPLYMYVTVRLVPLINRIAPLYATACRQRSG